MDSVAIGFFVGQMAIRATILTAVAAICLLLTRHSTAANRHRICAFTLAALVALPLVSLSLAPWEHSSLLGVIPSVPSMANIVHASVLSSVSWQRLIAVLWIAGFLFWSGRSVLGYLLVANRVRASTPPADATSVEMLEASARDLGVEPASVRLRCSNVTSALTCGAFRPVILLPEAASDWSPLRKRAVLLHELGHIRRKDGLFHYAAHVVCALFWFHPLAWWLAAELYESEELACDDLVLGAGVVSTSYASVLLESAREFSSTLLFACSMLGPASGKFRPSVLRSRFAHILSGNRNSATDAGLARWSPRIFVAAVLVVCSLVPVRADDVYRIGGDVSAPRLIEKHEPNYTQEAKEKRIEGTVMLSLVIGIDGLAREIQVQRSLDPGLDQNAVQAIEAWRFQPAERKGKPVAVRANIEVQFRLK